jgi:GNAT superfamily N-acetyltransferase
MMGVKYSIVCTTKNELDIKTYNRLEELTYYDGAMKRHLKYGNTKYILMAVGPRGGIMGWAEVCKDPSMPEVEVNVFVDRRYRHQGIGSKLKRAAIKQALIKHKSVLWFKNGWQRIKVNRRPNEKV